MDWVLFQVLLQDSTADDPDCQALRDLTEEALAPFIESLAVSDEAVLELVGLVHQSASESHEEASVTLQATQAETATEVVGNTCFEGSGVFEREASAESVFDRLA